MQAKDLLQVPSLKDAVLVAGKKGLHKEVNSINVLEAPDIAKWVEPGTVLLTSFFALSNFNSEELEQFFTEIEQAGVVAIVLKINRLIKETPDIISHLCNEHAIPLLVIEKYVRYVDIIMDVLLPIINHKASLLDRYYKTSTELAMVRMGQYSPHDVLQLFSEMLGFDLTLQNIPNRDTLTTFDKVPVESVVESKTLENDNFKGFVYRLETCSTQKKDERVKRIVVPVPLALHEGCELIVHGADVMTEEMLIMLNSMMRYLQIEILNLRNVDNMMYVNKNNLVSELLTNVSLTRRNLESILRALNLGYTNRYQVVQITLIPSNEHYASKSLELGSDNECMRIANKIEGCCRHTAYNITSNRLGIIINLDEGEAPLSSRALKDLLEDVDVQYVAGISEVGENVDIHELMQQTQKIKDIQKVFERYNSPLTYNELGVFKLLHDAESYDQILEYIPEKFKKLHAENSTLFETLLAYVQNGMNIQRTAEKLFVHPKTVSYRLDKIREGTDIDTGDTDDILQLLFAAKVLEK